MSRHFFLLLPLALCACNDKGDSAQPDDSDVDPIDSGLDTYDSGQDGPPRFTILHTNDLHSHVLGSGPNAEYTTDVTGDDSIIGGMARIKTLADEVRGASYDQVLLLDGGDWMAGTLFHLLGTSQAAELQLFQLLGYDAITIGNHEYDWGPGLLGEMISTADSLGVTVPIVASNIVPDDSDEADDALAAHIDSGRIESTRLLTLDNGLVVGLFGLLGEEAASVAPNAVPTSFELEAEAAALAVEELQTQGADVVILLSHSGVTDDPESSPDELLAAEVPGIDVIVGGHSHTPMADPIIVGDTVIVQAGCNSAYLGQLDLSWDGERVAVDSYQLHPIDDDILGDEEVVALTDELISTLDSDDLAELEHGFYDAILHVEQDVAATGCVETGLGHLVTDGFLYAMNATEPEQPIDFAFESHGVIRDGLNAGSAGVQVFSDVFRVLPLGEGNDDVPGYALVDFWVTAAELEGVCEVTASISPLFGCNYFIEVSGLRCNVDSVAVPFTRVESVEIWNGKAYEELDTSSSNETLYHVAVDSYVASLMGVLESLTSGLIEVTPKDAAGDALKDVDDMIFDADESSEEVDELKLWQALTSYAASFEDGDGDGVPELPEQYWDPEPRIVGYE